MTSGGTVRDYHPDDGWGVIDGPDVPGGCWVHFSSIAMGGYRQLRPGQQVSFRAEAADQDGFAFRAIQVWPDGTVQAGPDGAPVVDPAVSCAYSSSLTLTFDPPHRPD